MKALKKVKSHLLLLCLLGFSVLTGCQKDKEANAPIQSSSEIHLRSENLPLSCPIKFEMGKI